MWKPGTAAPVATTKKQHNEASVASRKEIEPADAGASSPSRQQQQPPAARARVAQLSGATRNMRFMKNKKLGSSSSSPSQPPHQKRSPNRGASAQHQQGESMEDDTAEDTTTTAATPNETPTQQRATERDDMDIAEDSDPENVLDDDEDGDEHNPIKTSAVATPLEMFGRERSVALGRRSFGGFNKVTAENWFHQQQEFKGIVAFDTKKRRHSAGDTDVLVRQAKRLKRESQPKGSKKKNNKSRSISTGRAQRRR